MSDFLKIPSAYTMHEPTDTTKDMFASAEQLSKHEEISKIYLRTRQKDYNNFCSFFKLSYRKGVGFVHVFSSSQEAIIREDGSIEFRHTNHQTRIFRTFVQFTAYYLAKFW